MPSPIYPGYYPGKPLYRDKRPFNKGKTSEFQLSAMEKFLQNLYENANLPRWVFEEELKTLQESLVIEGDSRNPGSSYSPSDMVGYGEENLQEMKGASVRFPISDFFENPGKALWESFVAKPIASITDWDEYRVESKGASWSALISREQGLWGSNNNPYQLYDTSSGRATIYGTPDGDGGPAKALVTYMHNSATPKKRNSSFAAYNGEVLKAWTKEFLDVESSGVLDLLSVEDREIFLAEKEALIRKSAVIENIDSFEKISSEINEVGGKSFSFTVSDLETKRGEFENTFAGLRKSLNNLTPEEQQKAGGLMSLIAGLDSKLFDPATGKLLSTTTDTAIYEALRSVQRSFHGTSLYKGVIGGYKNKLTDELLQSQRFTKILNLKITDASGTVRNLTSDESRALFRLTKIAKNDWEWEAWGDALTDLSKGRIPYQVIWKNFVLPRVERYTPSYWVSKYVKKYAKELGFEAVLTRYQNWLTGIQETYIGKGFLFFTNKTEFVKTQLTAWATALLSGAIAAATGGLSLLVERVLRVAIRFAVNKVVEAWEKFWKAAKKLDFMGFVEESIDGTMKLLTVIGAGSVGCMFVVLSIFTIFLTGFSPDDATKVATDISERADAPENLRAFGGFTEENCPVNDVLSLTFLNNSSNSPARAAHTIVNKLSRGFWCYWNHNPDYDDATDPDDLFNEAYFASDPFPPPAEAGQCADCLFWCTWLPIIAYRDAGMDFDPSASLLGARNMHDHFQRSQIFVNAQVPGAISQVRSGDIVFMTTKAGSGWHVAMVYAADQDSVMTIHSNAGIKEFAFTVSTTGTIQSTPDFNVVGFGRPR